MNDLLLSHIPTNQIGRIKAFARALAYGVVHKLWRMSFTYDEERPYPDCWSAGLGRDEANKNLITYLQSKWTIEQETPNPDSLCLFEYLSFVRHGSRAQNHYQLTSLALSLLDEPLEPPHVFIAYHREASSAFALLVEARLSKHDISVFLDKQIGGGDDWEKRLQEFIRSQTSHFICLIAGETLRRPVIQKELRWALETPNVIPIPIWHHGFQGTDTEIADLPNDLQDFVKSKQAIIVSDENPISYDSALSQLVNQLGYS